MSSRSCSSASTVRLRPLARAARASVSMRGASSARSRSSLPGSKRGCSADSFTEIDGRSNMASAFVAVKTPASVPTASIAPCSAENNARRPSRSAPFPQHVVGKPKPLASNTWARAKALSMVVPNTNCSPRSRTARRTARRMVDLPNAPPDASSPGSDWRPSPL